MMDCIFCKIARKEIPTEVFSEDTDVVVFKDIKPATPIHYLIVPKAHIPSIIHLTAGDERITSRLIFAAKEAAEKLNLKGYKLVFNVGREGGQVIDHLHLHLLGGWQNGAPPVLPNLPHPGMDN